MRRSRGFTLVELLVAIFAMSLLAVMAWRGLDGMTRAQSVTEAHSDEVLTLQTGLAQWGADLDAIEQITGWNRAIDWNGRVLRLTRRSTAQVADGMLVVAWTRRVTDKGGLWMRWQSPPVTTRGDLEQALQAAELWSQNQAGDDSAREVAITPLDDWQIFFFRDNAWTNPQSSGITAAAVSAAAAAGAASAPPPPVTTAAASAQPDGIRLVLSLPANQPVNGVVTRDWVRPQLTP
jgi:general secretion pathway protein J